jgi:hypothetical protein
MQTLNHGVFSVGSNMWYMTGAYVSTAVAAVWRNNVGMLFLVLADVMK